MLLVIDVGNTNIVMGVYDGPGLVKNWRVRTERNATEDEFFFLATGLFTNGAITAAAIETTVISCVVPPMTPILDAFCRKYLGHAPHWVDAQSYQGMPLLCDNPAEVGADRIVNAVGAYHKYSSSLIVVDFGTATTFDAISEQGAYLGGAISPGIVIAAEALALKASKLPRVELLKPPRQVIGKNTIHSMQSGLIFGYAALVDGMVARMKAELSPPVKVVATGGQARLIAEVADSIDSEEPQLTLEGLRIISREMVGV
jgi:type III pantothenate kinase